MEGFVAARAMNPDDGVSTSARFQQYIVFNGAIDVFDEDDMTEAASAVGIPDEEIGIFLDGLASWL